MRAGATLPRPTITAGTAGPAVIGEVAAPAIVRAPLCALPGLTVKKLPREEAFPEGAVTPTGLAELLRCSAEFKFRRIDHVEEEKTAALRWKSVMRAATRAFVAAVAAKSSLETARQAATTAALAELHRIDGEIAPAFVVALPKAIERLEERSWASGTPLLAGDRYILQLDGALPLVVRVDLALERNGEVVVVVYGVGESVEDALERAERDGAITAACIAVEADLGRPVRQAEIHLYARQNGKIAIVPTTRGQAARERFVGRLRAGSALVRDEAYRPTDAPAICTRCPFWSACTSTFGSTTE